MSQKVQKLSPKEKLNKATLVIQNVFPGISLEQNYCLNFHLVKIRPEGRIPLPEM